jgi:dihydrodipicolinate synthase/N-acetylneuraminate lyase
VPEILNSVFAGAISAAVTPLRKGGDAVDLEAIGPMVEHLVAAGVDGILALGTTGEGILLSSDERRAAAEAFLRAKVGRAIVIVHCGAQTTAATVKLATHAAELGADAVAVIAPPYFALDDASLIEHFTAAGRACAPLPFFVYEFAARSGYAVKPAVIEELRSRMPNLVGLKVSDAPWERFEPYLIDGLKVFVGPESLIHCGLAAGAASYVASTWVGDVLGTTGLGPQLLQVSGGVVAGLGAFIAMAVAFRLQELALLKRMVMVRLGRS